MSVKKEHTRHEIQMNRLLSEIADSKSISSHIFFKGGTCAKMRGLLDRFSVDLDFDIKEGADKKEIRKTLYDIFKKLNLEIKDESKRALQFFLKYPGEGRNTLKVEMLDKVYLSNRYEPVHLPKINRTLICQTVDTMFAHKLIAPLDRGGKVAGRDIYDIHHFFFKGYPYSEDIIRERRGVSLYRHMEELMEFIEKKVTRKVIEEDLNVLLEYDNFSRTRKYLKTETLHFIKKEVERV